MRRTFYLAGVNRKGLAAAASPVEYWLLSFTLLRRQANGLPEWLHPYLTGRQVVWDPGTYADRAVSYLDYRRFLDSIRGRGDPYLQYDEVGDADATGWYLRDMRRRGYEPIPVLQPGGDVRLLEEPRVAIGGLVPMPPHQRQAYLDELFYGDGRMQPVGQVHLLGIVARQWFMRYPARSGDATTWLPRSEWNRSRSIAEWLSAFGEQDVPFRPPGEIQAPLFARDKDRVRLS